MFKKTYILFCHILAMGFTAHLVYASDSYSKWVVITSINYPTDAIKKIIAHKDWHVVVVADKKTPNDWYIPDCDFLSLDIQKQLPYSIIKILPFNHYSRKNIGYLYAIEHGAQIIYDTDDDNIITSDSIVYLPKMCELASYNTECFCINPYAYFGQPTVWPRGYPLEYIRNDLDFSISFGQRRPLIQQGVVNNDPDVDAIFRLTRPLPIFFDRNKQPVGLPKDVMAPFNSQNTTFHYEAFWGLLIPMTPSFRVCDIWRGYWVQRLLWDIGGNLCFLPPAVWQERNEHNLLKDFEDEQDLYCKSGNLVRLLISWKSQKKCIIDRIRKITDMMIESGFYLPQEIQLVDAWINDLNYVGYTFPQVVL